MSKTPDAHIDEPTITMSAADSKRCDRCPARGKVLAEPETGKIERTCHALTMLSRGQLLDAAKLTQKVEINHLVKTPTCAPYPRLLKARDEMTKLATAVRESTHFRCGENISERDIAFARRVIIYDKDTVRAFSAANLHGTSSPVSGLGHLNVAINSNCVVITKGDNFYTHGDMAGFAEYLNTVLKKHDESLLISVEGPWAPEPEAPQELFPPISKK